jgi:hypothetical protein
MKVLWLLMMEKFLDDVALTLTTIAFNFVDESHLISLFESAVSKYLSRVRSPGYVARGEGTLRHGIPIAKQVHRHGSGFVAWRAASRRGLFTITSPI